MNKYHTKKVSSFLPDIPINEESKDKLFSYATSHSLSELEEFITTNSISLHIKNNNNQTIMHILLQGESTTDEKELLRCIKFLVERGAPISSIDKFNLTPLFICIKKNYSIIFTYLLEIGASLDINTYDNLTVLHILSQPEHVTYDGNGIKDIVPIKLPEIEIEKYKEIDTKINEALGINKTNVSKLSVPIQQEFDRYLDNLKTIVKQFYYDNEKEDFNNLLLIEDYINGTVNKDDLFEKLQDKLIDFYEDTDDIKVITEEVLNNNLNITKNQLNKEFAKTNMQLYNTNVLKTIQSLAYSLELSTHFFFTDEKARTHIATKIIIAIAILAGTGAADIETALRNIYAVRAAVLAVEAASAVQGTNEDIINTIQTVVIQQVVTNNGADRTAITNAINTIEPTPQGRPALIQLVNQVKETAIKALLPPIPAFTRVVQAALAGPVPVAAGAAAAGPVQVIVARAATAAELAVINVRRVRTETAGAIQAAQTVQAALTPQELAALSEAAVQAIVFTATQAATYAAVYTTNQADPANRVVNLSAIHAAVQTQVQAAIPAAIQTQVQTALTKPSVAIEAVLIAAIRAANAAIRAAPAAPPATIVVAVIEAIKNVDDLVRAHIATKVIIAIATSAAARAGAVVADIIAALENVNAARAAIEVVEAASTVQGTNQEITELVLTTAVEEFFRNPAGDVRRLIKRGVITAVTNIINIATIQRPVVVALIAKVNDVDRTDPIYTGTINATFVANNAVVVAIRKTAMVASKTVLFVRQVQIEARAAQAAQVAAQIAALPVLSAAEQAKTQAVVYVATRAATYAAVYTVNQAEPANPVANLAAVHTAIQSAVQTANQTELETTLKDPAVALEAVLAGAAAAATEAKAVQALTTIAEVLQRAQAFVQTAAQTSVNAQIVEQATQVSLLAKQGVVAALPAVAVALPAQTAQALVDAQAAQAAQVAATNAVQQQAQNIVQQVQAIPNPNQQEIKLSQKAVKARENAETIQRAANAVVTAVQAADTAAQAADTAAQSTQAAQNVANATLVQIQAARAALPAQLPAQVQAAQALQTLASQLQTEAVKAATIAQVAVEKAQAAQIATQTSAQAARALALQAQTADATQIEISALIIAGALGAVAVAVNNALALAVANTIQTAVIAEQASANAEQATIRAQAIAEELQAITVHAQTIYVVTQTIQAEYAARLAVVQVQAAQPPVLPAAAANIAQAVQQRAQATLTAAQAVAQVQTAAKEAQAAAQAAADTAQAQAVAAQTAVDTAQTVAASQAAQALVAPAIAIATTIAADAIQATANAEQAVQLNADIVIAAVKGALALPLPQIIPKKFKNDDYDKLIKSYKLINIPQKYFNYNILHQYDNTKNIPTVDPKLGNFINNNIRPGSSLINYKLPDGDRNYAIDYFNLLYTFNEYALDNYNPQEITNNIFILYQNIQQIYKYNYIIYIFVKEKDKISDLKKYATANNELKKFIDTIFAEQYTELEKNINLITEQLGKIIQLANEYIDIYNKINGYKIYANTPTIYIGIYPKIQFPTTTEIKHTLSEENAIIVDCNDYIKYNKNKNDFFHNFVLYFQDIGIYNAGAAASNLLNGIPKLINYDINIDVHGINNQDKAYKLYFYDPIYLKLEKQNIIKKLLSDDAISEIELQIYSNYKTKSKYLNEKLKTDYLNKILKDKFNTILILEINNFFKGRLLNSKNNKELLYNTKIKDPDFNDILIKSLGFSNILIPNYEFTNNKFLSISKNKFLQFTLYFDTKYFKHTVLKTLKYYKENKFITEILNKNKSFLLKKDIKGWTPIYYTIDGNNNKVLEKILEANNNTLIHYDHKKTSPLMLCINKQLNHLNYLLDESDKNHYLNNYIVMLKNELKSNEISIPLNIDAVFIIALFIQNHIWIETQNPMNLSNLIPKNTRRLQIRREYTKLDTADHDVDNNMFSYNDQVDNVMNKSDRTYSSNPNKFYNYNDADDNNVVLKKYYAKAKQLENQDFGLYGSYWKTYKKNDDILDHIKQSIDLKKILNELIQIEKQTNKFNLPSYDKANIQNKIKELKPIESKLVHYLKFINIRFNSNTNNAYEVFLKKIYVHALANIIGVDFYLTMEELIVNYYIKNNVEIDKQHKVNVIDKQLKSLNELLINNKLDKTNINYLYILEKNPESVLKKKIKEILENEFMINDKELVYTYETEILPKYKELYRITYKYLEMFVLNYHKFIYNQYHGLEILLLLLDNLGEISS
jgi:hypothetical protein